MFFEKNVMDLEPSVYHVSRVFHHPLSVCHRPRADGFGPVLQTASTALDVSHTSTLPLPLRHGPWPYGIGRVTTMGSTSADVSWAVSVRHEVGHPPQSCGRACVLANTAPDCGVTCTSTLLPSICLQNTEVFPIH